MIPAPNLATEAPGGGAAAAAPAGGDTYGSPQAAPVGGGGAAPDSYSGPDSYNAQPAPAPSDYSSALPAAPQAPRQENPFISQYNNAAPLPVIENNDLSGQFVEEADAYGAPAGGDVAPEPITDIDTPEGGEVVITGDFDVDVEGRAPVVLTEGEDLVEECTTGDVVDVAVAEEGVVADDKVDVRGDIHPHVPALGMMVTLCGLMARPELNGVSGRLEGFNEETS